MGKETVAEKKVDIESLKDRQPTQDDLDAIGAEVTAEADGKENAETKSAEDKEIERIAAEQAAEADKGSKETKEEKTEDKKDGEALTAEELKAEEERLLHSVDAELNDEDKGKKAELLKLREQDPVKKAQAEIESYALKQNISIEDAKKEFESIGKIEEKYGKDSKQLAQAYLHLQKNLAKKDEEIKQAQEGAVRASMPTVESYLQMVDSGKMLNSQTKKSVTRDELVDGYRKVEPELTAEMSDEQVLKLAAKTIIGKFEAVVEKNRSELTSKAKEKRVTLLNSIPEADRKYIAEEIKPLIEKYPDSQITSDAFQMQDVLYWVKGKHIDEILKEHGEKEYNRGLSEAKILGKKSSDNPKGTGAGGSGKKTFNLTEAQKNDAEGKYESALEAGTSKEEVYEWYAELNNIK